MEKALNGKVAVLTGSGRGIGKEIALMMAAEGARVVVNDLGTAYNGSGSSASVADQAVDEIRKHGGTAVANYNSVATSVEAERIIQTALDNFGGLDILVNIAAIWHSGLPWEMSDEDWDAVIKVHLYGHFYCSRAALRVMREAIRSEKQSNGRLINFASHSGILGSSGRPNFCAAKGGIVGLTYATAIDLKGSGITCNAIAPQAATSPLETIRDRAPDDQILQIAKKRGIDTSYQPDIGKLRKAILSVSPETFAPLVVWLASDESQHVNGQIFHMTEGAVGVFTKAEESKTVHKDGFFTIADISRAMQTLVPKPLQE